MALLPIIQTCFRIGKRLFPTKVARVKVELVNFKYFGFLGGLVGNNTLQIVLFFSWRMSIRLRSLQANALNDSFTISSADTP
jgi:hypothetical protein